MPNELGAVTLMTQLHTVFRIHLSPDTDLAVELVEVIEKDGFDSQQRSPAARQERFSAVFRGPRDRRLQQGLYQLQHHQLGALDLFLVPVGQDHDGLYYEAVFNRLRHADA
jgi:Domain of unknown function (DUF6916)